MLCVPRLILQFLACSYPHAVATGIHLPKKIHVNILNREISFLILKVIGGLYSGSLMVKNNRMYDRSFKRRFLFLINLI